MKKSPSIPIVDKTEPALLANIRALIESARNTVARGVDLVQVHTNFEIGIPRACANCPDSVWAI